MKDLNEDFYRHISSEFNEELEALRRSTLEMGGLVEEQLASALKFFASQDSSLLSDIESIEQKINAAEIDLDDQVESLIVRRQPIASDLRLVLAVSKIVRDLERMGDELEKVGRLSLESFDSSEGVGITEIQRIAEQVAKMLSESLTAFARLDIDLARDIFERERKVDKVYQSALRSLATFMIEDPRNIGRVLNIVWIARSLERVGDHATNIAEYVIYLVQGVDVRHPGVNENSFT
ncbi:MAG TPA: phosphate transport system regulatory protein PhoU [Gammaproteobacteria bacterium]|nr:phosphate transport system regulatory protein PhoU [Gammaproteobacteria bacterium]HBX27495.1 phosphate transport system regulatory protein PhoU [Gammaproteobacteria bacterium]|tara:strand:- start:1953 stop:2660 length:708 start_codon:yes stop_codon:yes gene_type:complete